MAQQCAHSIAKLADEAVYAAVQMQSARNHPASSMFSCRHEISCRSRPCKSAVVELGRASGARCYSLKREFQSDVETPSSASCHPTNRKRHLRWTAPFADHLPQNEAMDYPERLEAKKNEGAQGGCTGSSRRSRHQRENQQTPARRILLRKGTSRSSDHLQSHSIRLVGRKSAG